MKHLTHLLLIFALLLSPLAFSRAEEGSVGETQLELEKLTLAPAAVAENEKTVIRLSDGKVFEFDRSPDKEAMKAALGLTVPEAVKQQILARGGTVEDVNPLAPYESLSDERKAEFQSLRLSFLTQAARALNSTKFVFGAGSLVGNAFSFLKIKTLRIFGKETEATDTVQRSFNQRSHDAVQAVLRGIDYKLWSQAPLVIDSNEYGVSVSAGLIAETGILRRGGGGAEEVGISLAYNKTSRALVFEIYHNSENFDNTKAAVTVVGIVGKMGMSLARRQEASTLRGSSFYPPAIPGYTTSSPEFFSAGLSSSLGFPPPPLADLMTFTNTFERNALIRITVSPVMKGFVRIQVGDVVGSLRLVSMRFVDVFRTITDKVLRRSGAKLTCAAVFN